MNQGFLFTVLSALLYGSIGFFGSSLRQQGLSVLDLCLWRFAASAVLLLPFMSFFIVKIGSTASAIKNACMVFALGAIFYSTSTYFYFAASQSLGTGLAMIIFFTYPIYVVMIESFQKKAIPSAKIWIAISLIVVGCVLISCNKSVHFDQLGLCLGLISAFAYSMYVASSKHVAQSMHPIFATFLVCLGNAAAFFIASIFFQNKSDFIPSYASISWVYILLFAIFGTVLPVLLLLKGMKLISSSEAAIISVLEPVVVLAIGYLMLNEPLTAIQIFGSILILCSALTIVARR